ncbi:tyrosine-type recombinase/integrase [Sanguibacter antarcticus]|uniref:Phage integrase family protein n=1 Tax=Sanguibacter antarcticus TaxID=372484 RepID=A0A2A9E2I7_9MICO|nr:tyrosine-type recombinase/integrase [Sanguibacter antarcticus]PFG33168.1 phage integrase family protein [Sanguibacter antarcticus]
MTHAEAEWVWRELSVEALRTDAKPETVRLAVIVGLSRATGARYGDLLRCTMDSFSADQGSVVVTHGKHRTARVHPLDPDVGLVLRRWFVVRQELCAELEGSVPRALLLTVHHTHDNGVTVIAGLPITKQGLVLSWRRFVHRTNARHAGFRDPLPTRFEQLRRAWWAHLHPSESGDVPDEPGTDDESDASERLA